MNVKDSIIQTERVAFGQVKLNYLVIFTIFKAAWFIVRKPSYLKYIIISVIINIISFFLIASLLALAFFGLIEYIQSFFDIELNGYVDTTIFVILFIFGLFLSSILFNSVASIINSPVYDAMTERILNDYKIEQMSPYEGKFQIPLEVWSSISFELKKIILSIFFFILTTLMNLVPAVGNVLFVGTNTLNLIITNGLGTFDPVLSRNKMRFRNKLQFILENPAIWPFLIVSGILNAIPFLNFLTIPLTIVASVMIYVEVLRQGKEISE